LPGIALFLAHLGKLTGEERWTVLARSAVAAFLRYLADAYEEEELDTLSPIGAFNGLGGQLYALAHLGTLWQDERLIQAAGQCVEIAELLLEDIAEDEDVGLADGLAGCLAGLLAVYQVAPTPRTLEVARRAGDELLICLQYNESSTTADVSRSPFDHFLYGRPGTAWTLRQLAAISGEDRYGVDPVDVPDDVAPGLLMARVRMLPWMSDVVYRERLSGSLRAALPAVLEEGLGGNHSLGFGDMGYLDLLLQAAVTLDDAGLRQLCGDYAAAVLAGAQENGWRYGTPLNVETPGLMTGLAGIGYMLLRLVAPERVPSVLGLEMPVGSKQ
jgi:lantibiotic modifying enzyme